MPLTVTARRVLAGGPVRPDLAVVVNGDRIIEVRPARRADPPVAEGWLVPGFVETHCHGGGGADYATTDPAEALAARDFHARYGTTTTLASLVTAPVPVLVEQIRTLAPLVVAGELAGIHLEGPFLAAGRCGAHHPDLLLDPEPGVLDRLLAAGGGAVTMITLAPELPGALAAIRRLAGAGVRVAVGHTDADAAITARALDAGATVATHLFNAMPPVHHRRPGPVPVLLTDPRVTVEVIMDGRHLDPDVIKMTVAAAGSDRTAMITDAVAAAGRPDGTYRLGSLRVRVSGGETRVLTADGSPGALAGSTLTMGAALERAVSWGLEVPDVARMAATTPASAHGLGDVGQIVPGRRADLCLLDDAGRLQRVMRAGRWLDPA